MRKMKDSGIEWIGEIPESWDVERLKYHIDFNPPTDIPPYDDEQQVSFLPMDCLRRGTHTIQIADYEKVKKGYVVFQNGDILMAKVTPCLENGNIAIARDLIDNVGFGSTEINVIRCSGIHRKYLFYTLQCKTYIERAVADMYGVAGLKRLNPSFIPNMKHPIPSLDEQTRIADYLDKKCAEIDAIIAAKEKTNELLKERRQSIIYEAVTKGLDSTVPMKDSGIEWIGEIPESWDVCPVKYVIDKNHPYPVGDGDHGLIKADDYLDEGIPYIRVLNLTWGEGLNLENLVYISDEMNSRIKNSELKPNDILIAKTGATIGKTAIVPDSLPRSNTTSHVGKITISSDHDAVFFYYVMTSSIVQRQIQILSAMQSTRPELGIDGLRNLLVVVPPVEKQRDISKFLNQQCAEINSVIDTNSSMIDKLKEYRQSVIYEAVTGKVEV